MATLDLKASIKQDVIAAMRSKDKDRLSVLRMLQAAIKQKEIDDKITLDDTAVLSIIEKMIKQRRESVQLYTTGNRPELAAKENQEITVLATYLPEQLSPEELTQLIEQTINQVQASSMQDMGKVMQILKEKAQGRANMAELSAKVKQSLS